MLALRPEVSIKGIRGEMILALHIASDVFKDIALTDCIVLDMGIITDRSQGDWFDLGLKQIASPKDRQETFKFLKAALGKSFTCSMSPGATEYIRVTFTG